MGLLRRSGPPVGITDFHPAGHDLRLAIQNASDFCDGHGERLDIIAIRFALESWILAGSAVGSRGDPASGVAHRRETIEEVGGEKLGVSVMGVSKLSELKDTMRVWRSILDGLENGQETANAAGRWRKDHEWSLNRKKAVLLLAEGIQESLGDWLDHTWPSPPVGFVNRRGKEATPPVEEEEEEDDVELDDNDNVQGVLTEQQEDEEEAMADKEQMQMVVVPWPTPDGSPDPEELVLVDDTGLLERSDEKKKKIPFR